jgi:outer membrane lipoprotein-sorting protein
MPGPDDRLFAHRHRLAGAGIHPARDPRIPAANCGGVGPCLTQLQIESTASCAFLICSFCSSASCSLASQFSRAAPLAAPDAEAILKRSDGYRNGWPSYVLHVKITNFESNKADEEKLYEVSQKGTEKTYVEFMSPREKGQHLLMLGDDMWVYLPDTSRPVRITPLERLSGDASNGDVARTNYAADYTPVYVRTEKVGCAGRLLRAQPHCQAQGRNLSAHPLTGFASRMTVP